MRSGRALLVSLAFFTWGSRAAAADSSCFPACRANFVCSPQGQCVSACNPVCSAEETCTEKGECVSKSSPSPSSSSAAAETPAESSHEHFRHFELTLGAGAEKVGNSDFAVAPEGAFLFVAPIGDVVELLIGFRARVILGDAVVPVFGPEAGVRFHAGSESVKGGIFITARPEVALGHLTRDQFQGALSFGGSIGPYLEIGPFIVRVPFAAEVFYVPGATPSEKVAGGVSIGGEAGIRF